MQDVHARLEALPAGPDEVGGRALEPGGRHPAVGMPDRREPVPVPGMPAQGHFSTSCRIRNSSASCSVSMPGPSARPAPPFEAILPGQSAPMKIQTRGRLQRWPAASDGPVMRITGGPVTNEPGGWATGLAPGDDLLRLATAWTIGLDTMACAAVAAVSAV